MIRRLGREGVAIMPKPELDGVDHRILAALQSDARLTNVELAERVALSPSPCLRRVKRLERDGYIEGYGARLQRARVGLGVTVFLGNDRAEAFQDAVTALPEVVACHLVSGDFDYLLEIVTPDLEAYQRVLVDKLLSLPIVKEVRSNIALQTLKAATPLPLDHLADATVD
jgi:Lrp/AsnC family leucine-responsive transcriptional regulator